MKKNVKIRYSLLAISLAALAASCGSASEQSAMTEQAPQETDFIQLNDGSAAIKQNYPGSIEGSVNVDIKAQVTGYLEAIYVKEGDYVQKGQNMFRIKGDVFNEQINNSEAALKSALAAQATAKIELEKLKPLVDGKVISDIQLREAQTKYEAATAQVAQAKASLGSSRVNANFALIKAPVSGYIGRIPNRIGNLVTPSDNTPLTTLSDINTVYVYFSMSEADFITYKKDNNGDKNVKLVMADGSFYPQQGTLEIASGNVDRTTGSMSLKAVFSNPDKILRNGGSVQIILGKTLNDVLVIPKASVKDIQDKYFVFKLGDSSKVSMTPIEITSTSGNSYIMKSGLSQGDKIAVNRIDVLTEGMMVKAKMVHSIDSTTSSIK